MTTIKLTPVPGAETRYDEEGREILDIVTCGSCGRSWNDAAVSSWTPAPSGRCPFEYEHEQEEEEETVTAGDLTLGELLYELQEVGIIARLLVSRNGLELNDWLDARGIDPETPIPVWNNEAQAWEV